MLKFLKRWLGWDADSTLFDFSDLRVRQPPTPHTLGQSGAPTPVVKQQPAPNAAPHSRRDKSKERDPRDVLDNPRLTLGKPVENDGFDPYNTGAFNRSTSWERIGRHKKR